jgi:glycogen debranching enzyme
MAGWNADTAAGPVGAGTVTLVEETSFCISLPNGDIHPEHPHGLFVQDTRFLSRWNLTVNSQPLESLAAETREPFRALFAGRVPRSDGYADSPLIVERLREVGAGIKEQLTVRNYSTKPVQCVMSLEVEADFADLFEVKEARIQRTWDASRHVDRDQLTIDGAWQGMRKRVVIQAPGADVKPEAVTYRVSVPPHGHWSAIVSATAEVEGSARSAALVHPDGEVLSPSDRRRKEWVAKIPVVRMSNRSIERTLRRSYDDLGALRIEDPSHPERVVVAAGAPWFMTLFGRDSLWASEMALPVDPSLALGTLQTLADRQGSVVDPLTEEEPGKILHEVRFSVNAGLALGGKSAYYGSVDATPLFVDVLGAVSRWGFGADIIADLLPHADRALDWIRHYGDKDGDGFVEYERLNDQGLINQGWKDSWDGINFADGTLAEPPIAYAKFKPTSTAHICRVRGWVRRR